MFKNNPTVLIAGEASEFGEDFLAQLEHEGIAAVVAPFGEDVRDALETNDSIGVVLANLANPNTGGYALARRIKKQYGYMVFILMADRWDGPMHAQAKGCGVDECHTKDPKSCDTLIALIKKQFSE